MPPTERSRRALRYRRLADEEADRCKASMLRRIADEAEDGLLCTASRTSYIRLLTPSATGTYGASSDWMSLELW